MIYFSLKTILSIFPTATVFYYILFTRFQYFPSRTAELIVQLSGCSTGLRTFNIKEKVV